jgi:RNA polymerase sigma factor for flagellar operon FliA
VSPPEAHELLTSNLALIERAIAYACRRNRLSADDADEFQASVKLKLVENDYAILRAYEQRSSFATFISIVVQRMALDYRISTWGKWHTSAEAKRLGALAVDLERLVHRDGRSLDEALTILRSRYQDATRDSLASIAARLPTRAPRHHEVDLGEADGVSAQAEVEERLLTQERKRLSERVSAVMSEVIARLADDDRLILQLRFEGELTVAQIARVLQIEQKLLYRRIENRMRELKRELEKNGIAWSDVLDLIGREESLLQFDIGNRDRRPSMTNDGTAPTEQPQ